MASAGYEGFMTTAQAVGPSVTLSALGGLYAMAVEAYAKYTGWDTPSGSDIANSIADGVAKNAAREFDLVNSSYLTYVIQYNQGLGYEQVRVNFNGALKELKAEIRGTDFSSIPNGELVKQYAMEYIDKVIAANTSIETFTAAKNSLLNGGNK